MPEPVFSPIGKEPGPSERILVSMPRGQLTRMKMLAKEFNLTTSELCRQAIAFALDHMGDKS